MEDEILSKDARLDDGDGMKLARDLLNTMPSYRIDPSRIRIPETEPGKRGERGVIFMGELTPAAESTTPKFGQTVAVKTVDWNHEDSGQFNLVFKSFAYELSLIKTLSHPNIAKLVGFVEDIQERDARFILPWKGNGNVQDFLRSGEWEIPERISLIQDTASGLEYLHTRQPPIRHGDLKSLHILVSSSYRAVITGFWSARIMSKVGENTKDDHWLWSLCKLGIYLKDDSYTVRWAAPERIYELSAGLPVDLWALGCVCWEVVTGRFPFEDAQDDTTVVRHLKLGNLPAILNHAALSRSLLPQLCSLMLDCWMMDPAKRIDVSTFRKKAGFLPSTTPSGNTAYDRKGQSATLLLELGRMHDLQNDTEMAERFYKEALSGAIQTRNETVQANALIGLGGTYNTRSWYSKAEKGFKEAHETHSRIGNDLGAANALIGLGETYSGRSRYSEAEERFKEAHETHSGIGNDLGAANALISLGETYSGRSRYSEAEKGFTEAHEIHSRIGNDLGAANALIGLGRTYYGRSWYSEAEETFKEAREIHSRIGDSLGVANALIGLGEVYSAQSRYRKAEQAFKDAHETHSRIGNSLGVAKAFIGVGEVYDAQSRCSEALQAFRNAGEIHSRVGNDLGAADVLIGVGRIFITLLQYPEAEKAFMEAREIHSRIGNDRGTADASVGLGRVYNARSRYSEAGEVFTKAQEIYSRIGNKLGVANALIGLGEVYKSQSRYSEAEEAFGDADKIHSLGGNELGLANALLGLGEIYGVQSKYPEAEKAFTKAYEIHSRIGNYVGAVNAVVSLGEIYYAQSRYFEAEEAFKKVPDIVPRIGNNLPKANSLNGRGESYDTQSGDSGDEEYSKEAAELHLRDETSIGASDTLTDSREIRFDAHAVDFKDEEPLRGAPEIHSRIHNDSRSATAVENLQQVNFIQEIASIESISMPSTQHIVDLILALAKTAPTAIRGKHQLYRILIISRDLCYHLHCLAHTRGESSGGINVLEQSWEIIDNLERTLLELNDIASQETVPFEPLSLATWNNSRRELSRIYGELTAPPFDTYRVDDSAIATSDRYFDDCSWMSLLLLEGIEHPVQNMHPDAEEGFSSEAQNVIDRLNYLVNETKLNGNTDEPTRELFIDILSGVTNMMMNGLDNLPVDFWIGADRALQDIDLEKGLNQDLVDSLRDSWSGFMDRQIQQASPSRSLTPGPTQDPIAVSIPQELTLLGHEITPATEPLVLLLHSLGRGAPTAKRNKHKIYAIVSRARDICNHILAIGIRPEVGGLETLDEYYNLIDALEGVLLDVARLLPAEQVSFGLEMCESWSEGREEFRKILNRLHEPPFRLDPSAPKQEFMNNSVFDDQYWLSLLLEDGIEKELGRQYSDIEMPPAVVSVREGLWYLDNEIKCGYQEEKTRDLVIDIATRLYEVLSASIFEKGSNAELPIRSAEPPPPIMLDKDTLVTALSIAFSVLDLDSSLESQDIHRLAGNWWGISHSSPTRHSGSLGESKLSETGSSRQVAPVGPEDQETSQDTTKSHDYWLQLHKIISRRNLAYSEEMVPRDNDRDESWIVMIHITGEDVDTLRLTGAGSSEAKAKDAVARLALIVFGEIVGEE